jgi:oxygen-independent coproporphyrinogen III oxidase
MASIGTGRDRATNQTAESQVALREQVRQLGSERVIGEQTEAGNYFVANYPPFSFWDSAYIGAAEGLLRSPAPRDEPLGLYFHIPFCRKRCHFCYFRVYTDKNSDEIRRYLDVAMKEFEWYASQPYLAGRKPSCIYFGGGTPSYLSPGQLHELTGRMKELMPWDEVEEVAFECEPGTLNEKKLVAIKEIGVTRLSLGVENFNADVLELNGRAHRADEIARAYELARAQEFAQINIDLIAGMMGETEENWAWNVEKAIEMAPEMVTIYQMEIPFNTSIYKQMKEEGKATAPVADWKTKRRWVAEAFAAFEAAGYHVSSGTTVVKDPGVKFVYRDALFGGWDVLSLGVASFGHLGGIHLQNHHDIGPYMERVEESGKHGLYRAYVTEPEERLIREFVLTLKLGRLDLGHFRRKFDINPLDRFAVPLAPLVADGIIEVEDNQLIVTRDGLLQIDRLLPAFFLPQHQNARYA